MLIKLHNDQLVLIEELTKRRDALESVSIDERSLNEELLLAVLDTLLAGVRCHDVNITEASKRFPPKLVPLFEAFNNAISSLVSEFPELELKIKQTEQYSTSGDTREQGVYFLDPLTRKCLGPYLK